MVGVISGVQSKLSPQAVERSSTKMITSRNQSALPGVLRPSRSFGTTNPLINSDKQAKTPVAGRSNGVLTLASRNLVVAADASEEAIEVFNWTLQNLYREGDQLHVLHVVPDVMNASPNGFYYPQAYDSMDFEDADRTMWEQAEAFILENVVKEAKLRGVNVNVVLVKESSDHHIGRLVCKKAEELEAAPLVLATHDKKFFERMLLGSISKFCATHCKRPVLLLHPDHSAVPANFS